MYFVIPQSEYVLVTSSSQALTHNRQTCRSISSESESETWNWESGKDKIHIMMTLTIQTRDIMVPSQWVLLPGSLLALDPCEPKHPRIVFAKGAQQQSGIVLRIRQTTKFQIDTNFRNIPKEWQTSKQQRLA